MCSSLGDQLQLGAFRNQCLNCTAAMCIPCRWFFGAARAIARGIRLLRRRSQTAKRVCSLLLSTAARDFSDVRGWALLDGHEAAHRDRHINDLTPLDTVL